MGLISELRACRGSSLSYPPPSITTTTVNTTVSPASYLSSHHSGRSSQASQACCLAPHGRQAGAQPKILQKSLILRTNMRVTIKEWNAVASWRWDMPEDDVCGICRVQFDGTCPTCKYPGDDCALCMLCSHVLIGPIGLIEDSSNWHLRPLLPHGM